MTPTRPPRPGRPPRRLPRASAPALRLTGVTVWEWDARLRQRQPILNGIDWTVGPGEQWAVLGPNGAGKSTLLDIAAGMRHPSRGAVRDPRRDRRPRGPARAARAHRPRGREDRGGVLAAAHGAGRRADRRDRDDPGAGGAARRGGARAGGAAARAVRLRRRGASTRSRRARRASGGASCWLAP